MCSQQGLHNAKLSLYLYPCMLFVYQVTGHLEYAKNMGEILKVIDDKTKNRVEHGVVVRVEQSHSCLTNDDA